MDGRFRDSVNGLAAARFLERGFGLRFLVMMLGATALAGCASRPSPVPLNHYQPVPAAEAAQPPTNAVAGYRINPLDQVRVDVFGEPDLSLRDLPVDLDGNIVIPLAGKIEAKGRTTEELSRQIAAALGRYLRRPQVAVNITQFTSQKITVTGAVKVPGVFQSMDQMTLMDAIAMGQGLGDYSKSNEIIVFRRQGGQRYVARFDMAMIQDGEAADPTILPGDVVVVGYSEARRRFSDAIAVLPAAVGIFIALLPRF